MSEIVRLHPFIDMHVHMRDMGQEHKEDFYTGTSAALSGGVTFVADMPNNKQLIDSPQLLSEKRMIAQKKIVSDIGFYAGTLGNPEQDLEGMIPHALGLKIYMNTTTGHFVVDNREDVRKVMRKWDSEKPILVHAEGDKTKEALEEAEDAGRNIHICHVSTKEQVDWIRKAKMRRGPESVTAEVTPQHLVYTALWSADPYKQLKPEFGKIDDLHALWTGLRDGTIDVVATDHAPHTKKEKDSDKPPSGVTGLETTVAVLLRAERIGELTMERIKEITYDNPRKLLGLHAQTDTYIEVLRGESYYIHGEAFQTKCHTTPFEGLMAEDRVVKTVIRGRTVYENGKVLAPVGSGKVYPQIS